MVFGSHWYVSDSEMGASAWATQTNRVIHAETLMVATG